MPLTGQSSLRFATPVVFNAQTQGFPWDELRKILHESQRMAKVHSGEEILLNFNPLSRVHEHYKQTTDR